jgi:hypothetical protein
VQYKPILEHGRMKWENGNADNIRKWLKGDAQQPGK